MVDPKKASRYGYMGPEFKAMFEVGVIVCSRYLRKCSLPMFYRPVETLMNHWMTTLNSKELTETYWSVENNKKAIVSDEFRLRQNYRKVPQF